MPVRWDAKNKNGITGLHKIVGGDYGIEEPHWVPSYNIQLLRVSAAQASFWLAH